MVGSSLFPGFRFHPTDVELVMYYLKRKLLGKKLIVDAVTEVNIYDFRPWDLPDKSSLKNGDLEWFFFCPKSKKYSSGSRSNRATEVGFWKATGKDRKVTYKERTVATIKTLVFHSGQTGTGQRTDWVMYEYKMDDMQLANAGVVQDKYVLCKVFEKSGSGPRTGAQYGAPFYEEAWDEDLASCSGSQAIVGPNTVDPATKNIIVPKRTGNLCITEPDSSAVTYSTNTLNNYNKKLKAPVMNVTLNEPGSSALTYFPDENTTNTLNDCNKKRKAPVMTVSVNEPGLSAVTYSPVENTTNTLNNCNKRLKAPVVTVSVNEPGSSSLTFSPNETTYVDVPPVSDDMMLFEDLVSFFWLSPEEDLLNGNNKNEGLEVAKSMAPKEDEGIYDELVNFINLDDLNGENLKNDGAAATDLDADLGVFYVD